MWNGTKLNRKLSKQQSVIPSSCAENRKNLCSWHPPGEIETQHVMMMTIYRNRINKFKWRKLLNDSLCHVQHAPTNYCIYCFRNKPQQLCTSQSISPTQTTKHTAHKTKDNAKCCISSKPNRCYICTVRSSRSLFTITFHHNLLMACTLAYSHKSSH